jgi:hypothetical protein
VSIAASKLKKVDDRGFELGVTAFLELVAREQLGSASKA